MVQILTPKDTYTIDYPWAIEFADDQNAVFWTHEEIDLSKDIQDIRVELTESERHGVLTVLKLFVKYELKVNDYWSNVVAKLYPRPDIQRMAASFSFFETNVHAPFYDKINKELNLDTDEFYNSYLEDEILRSRIEYIDWCLSDKQHPLFSSAVFSMIEGSVLYSNFSYLKHFQSQGKNKMKNLVAGINFSTRDEHLHSIAGATLHNTLKQELIEANEVSQVTLDVIREMIVNAAKKIFEHEEQIVYKIFEKGEIENITAYQMIEFVKSRINLCLENIGIEPIFEITDTSISEWFYLGISSAKIHDFFAKMGNQYHRVWDEQAFIDTW